ncbi:MAG: hypothetical protein K0S09_537 [Sphingobacteriaceae bacterium]|jgi:hypothetical protein|nr:hypothetical protein [Sphingobacteriaceae bacterium]
MRKLLFFFVCFLHISVAKSQVIEGYVISENTIPVSYATISINNIVVGFSDLQGKFQLAKPENLTDSLLFSCGGFVSKKVTYKELRDVNKVILKRLFIELKEVAIDQSNGVLKSLKLGNLSRNLVGSFHTRPNVQYALFIENTMKITGYIKSASFFIKQPPGGDYRGLFRIRIYKKDPSSNMPGEDLLNQNILVHADKNNSWFTVDLSKYNLVFEDDGLFVAMETLPKEQYLAEGKLKPGITPTYWNNLNLPGIGFKESMSKSYSWIKSKAGYNYRWTPFDTGSPNPANFLINIDVDVFS